MLSPRLPSGCHAQLAFHHQDGTTGYDFYRVYTPEREHDLARSYWLITEDEDTRGPMPPSSRFLSFVDWAHAQHKDVMAYGEFANAQTPVRTVRKWVDAGPSQDLVTIREL
jgi:hypothetical protein